MERFEMMIDSGLVEFKGFLSKTKESLSSLIDDIKSSISSYETRIKDAEDEVKDTENSSQTCEQEILKQQERIKLLKKSIDNVEKTYKKMVDAYSSTSEGSTKDIYSDIIETARESCERDVEKNNTEIDSINDTIYSIKNNIKEFNSTIDRLNRELDEYNSELAKYKRALQYMQKVYDGITEDLSDVESGKNSRINSPIRKANEKTYNYAVEEKSITDEIEIETEAEHKDVHDDSISREEELQKLYDLTGYKPEANTKEEQKPEFEEESVLEEPVYSGNLENLFINSGVEDHQIVQKEQEPQEQPKQLEQPEFNDNALSEWEQMLNEKTITFDEPIKKIESEVDTVNQLLVPYGTTYERLVKLADDRIEYKDGTILPVEITAKDILDAINQIDALDLKSMKIVGPETTLLKKIKKIKEEVK